MSKKLTVVIEFSPGIVLTGLVFLFLLGLPLEIGADSLTMTTWYPAPYGVYTHLRSTQDAYFAYKSGNVGVGTASPKAKLDINGSTRFADQTVVPDSACGPAGSGGLQRYNSTNNQMEFCNGTSWQTSGGGGIIGNYSFKVPTWVYPGDIFMGTGKYVSDGGSSGKFYGTVLCDPTVNGTSCGTGRYYWCGSDENCVGRFASSLLNPGPSYDIVGVAGLPVSNVTQNW